MKTSLSHAIRVFCVAGGGKTFGGTSGFHVGRAAHSFPSPLHNAALRLEPTADPEELMLLLDSVFRRIGRSYVLWVDSEVDADLWSAAVDAGLAPTSESTSAAMIATPRPPKMLLPPQISIERVSNGASARDFASTVCDSFGFDNSHRQLVESALSSAALVNEEGVDAYVLRSNGAPVSSAVTISFGATAGLYYVGTRPFMRGRGMAELIVNRATVAAFERGLSRVCLEANPSLFSFYRKCGFSQVGTFHTLSPKSSNTDMRSI